MSLPFKTKQILQKGCVVYVAGIWGEGYLFLHRERFDLKGSELAVDIISWLIPVRG